MQNKINPHVYSWNSITPSFVRVFSNKLVVLLQPRIYFLEEQTTILGLRLSPTNIRPVKAKSASSADSASRRPLYSAGVKWLPRPSDATPACRRPAALITDPSSFQTFRKSRCNALHILCRVSYMYICANKVSYITYLLLTNLLYCLFKRGHHSWELPHYQSLYQNLFW